MVKTSSCLCVVLVTWSSGGVGVGVPLLLGSYQDVTKANAQLLAFTEEPNIYNEETETGKDHSPVYDCHEVNYPQRGPEDQIARRGDDLYEVRDGGGAHHVRLPHSSPPPGLRTD